MRRLGRAFPYGADDQTQEFVLQCGELSERLVLRDLIAPLLGSPEAKTFISFWSFAWDHDGVGPYVLIRPHPGRSSEDFRGFIQEGVAPALQERGVSLIARRGPWPDLDAGLERFGSERFMHLARLFGRATTPVLLESMALWRKTPSRVEVVMLGVSLLHYLRDSVGFDADDFRRGVDDWIAFFTRQMVDVGVLAENAAQGTWEAARLIAARTPDLEDLTIRRQSGSVGRVSRILLNETLKDRDERHRLRKIFRSYFHLFFGRLRVEPGDELIIYCLYVLLEERRKPGAQSFH